VGKATRYAVNVPGWEQPAAKGTVGGFGGLGFGVPSQRLT